MQKLAGPDWQAPLWVAVVCLRMVAERCDGDWPAAPGETRLLLGFFAAAAAAISDSEEHAALLDLALRVVFRSQPLWYGSNWQKQASLRRPASVVTRTQHMAHLWAAQAFWHHDDMLCEGRVCRGFVSYMQSCHRSLLVRGESCHS